MTADAFRKLALALPGASEGSHMGHADFRAGGRIFASIIDEVEGPAMVRVSPDVQADLVAGAPAAFRPCNGAWGRDGATFVALKKASPATVKKALRAAWERANAM